MKKQQETQEKQTVNQYKGLPRILHSVRWTQHLFAILAEVLILLAFAMSGMDANLGGVMTGVTWLKWAWAAAFALGIDTSFVISWVRVRKCVDTRTWAALSWNLLLALGMSFIVFQPVAIQLLQQSLAINFSQALFELGINLVILVYGRALVAVFLGAILAMTNVESDWREKASTVSSTRRTFLPLKQWMDKYMPEMDTVHVQPETTVEPVAEVQAGKRVEVKPKRPIELKAVPGPRERVRQALDTNPGASDRQIARMSHLSPSTVGKYRKMMEDERIVAVSLDRSMCP